MQADAGTLTVVLNKFLVIFKLGQAAVSRDAMSLLAIIAIIELTISGLAWAFTANDAIYELFKKILLISFFVYLIDNYDQLVHIVIDGFIYTGKTAATGSTDVFDSFKDPSSIIKFGFELTLPIAYYTSQLSFFTHLIDIIMTGVSLILILAAFFIIAIQVFVTYLEFALISTLALIFLPFGVFRHTAFLAERTFAAVISFGVKLMVLGLLVSIGMPILKEFSLPVEPNWTNIFHLLVTCMAMAALSWHAPGVAAGLLSGTPSLTAQTALSSTAGATAITGGAALGTVRAGVAGTMAGAAALGAAGRATKAYFNRNSPGDDPGPGPGGGGNTNFFGGGGAGGAGGSSGAGGAAGAGAKAEANASRAVVKPFVVEKDRQTNAESKNSQPEKFSREPQSPANSLSRRDTRTNNAANIPTSDSLPERNNRPSRQTPPDGKKGNS